LPPTLGQNGLLRSAQAEFSVRAGDWEQLRKALLAGAWGPVPTAAVEQAFRVRVTVGNKPSTTVAPGWVAAIEAAKASPPGLRMLLRLSEIWRWPAERRAVLWVIARTLPREGWAWRQLISEALSRDDSDQLWQIYGEWRRAQPGEPLVQVESAIMGFLLARRPVPSVIETAGYVDRQPDSAGAAVAHALGLWRAGRFTEAAGVLDARSPADFNEPRYALARGIVLAEVGRAKESEEVLARLAGEYLLPEERALLAAARQRNRGARP
jgi:hypothetical protein